MREFPAFGAERLLLLRCPIQCRSFSASNVLESEARGGSMLCAGSYIQNAKIAANGKASVKAVRRSSVQTRNVRILYIYCSVEKDSLETAIETWRRISSVELSVVFVLCELCDVTNFARNRAVELAAVLAELARREANL